MRKIWDKYTEGWFGIIVYLFLGFVIAYGVNIALSFILGTQTPVVAVFSNSMIPTFYRGDMIMVYGEKNLKVGDIVVFDSPDKKYPIIHRIHEIRDSGIITKGDNVPSTDEGRWGVISLEDIYGKAFLKIPILGWVKILFVELTGLG
ncbi:MAG: signal peptidase I [Candidatus Aenigmarchaeota archaeon]|nr:signal peptidase I [Candidatus Aenigmarchaeota archaeon]